VKRTLGLLITPIHHFEWVIEYAIPEMSIMTMINGEHDDVDSYIAKRHLFWQTRKDKQTEKEKDANTERLIIRQIWGKRLGKHKHRLILFVILAIVNKTNGSWNSRDK